MKRHTAEYHCPVCGGCEDDPRGQDVRCWGYTNEKWIYCTRVDASHGKCIFEPDKNAWVHKFKGKCNCGIEHNPADPGSNGKKKGTFDRAYQYCNLAGDVVHETVRWKNPKGFSQRRPDGNGKYIWKMDGVKRVLYHLPELAWADDSLSVWICEGEKDADNLAAAGMITTTCAEGAKKWQGHGYEEILRGRHVRIVPHNDEPGRQHAQQIAQSLHGVASSVKVVELPGLGPGEDVSDFLARGGTSAELDELALKTPLWEKSPQAGQPVDKTEDKPVEFSNFEMFIVENEAGEKEERRKSLRISEIADQLDAIAPGWPKRIEEELFISSRDHEPVYLDSSTRLMAWVDQMAKVDWTRGNKFVTEARFYEYLRMTSRQFDAIETLPHWPTIPGIYYMHQEIPAPAGKLESLLEFFEPETPIDRELIKAMILTLFWGGAPGSRPAFLICGPDVDEDQGRGVGKSILCQIMADLAGGAVTARPKEEIEGLVKRLLSNEAGRKRVVSLDNLKTFKFSWAELEALITADVISGHAMYRGEGNRPNLLTWLITMNGATLSKDMAHRCIQILLKRPTFKPSWESDVREFVDKNRWELIADIKMLLEAPSPVQIAASRWGAWEHDVLGKCQDWGDLQKIIKIRKNAIDDDDSEKQHVRDFISTALEGRSHDPDIEVVRISSLIMAQWVSDATRTKYPTNKATAFVKGLGISELRHVNQNSWRGWIWTGSKAKKFEPVELNSEPTWRVKADERSPY